jgi:signal transduction histidine kinase
VQTQIDNLSSVERLTVASVTRDGSILSSRWFVLALSAFLVVLIGYLDYKTGYEASLLIFYLIPVALAIWYGNVWFGLGFSVLSVAASVVSDVFQSGSPGVQYWNVGMAFAAYVIFTLLFSKLRTLLRELDQRVRERTAALQREIAERERLDREVAEVADRERRRLGRDLHDSLGQHLTGTALAAQVLREKLAARSSTEVVDADKVVRHIEEGIDLTRNLARGFFSPELAADGLAVALQGLAVNVSERFQVTCDFKGDEAVQMPDSTTATQLYHIAQEAVMNAVKHANAHKIDIELERKNGELILAVVDDGVGLPDELPRPPGLGLRLMAHGAALIGGKFAIKRNRIGGTTVTCKLTIPL